MKGEPRISLNALLASTALAFLAGGALRRPSAIEKEWINLGKRVSRRAKELHHLRVTPALPLIVKGHLRNAYRLFIFEFYRPSAILSALTIEVALRERCKAVNGKFKVTSKAGGQQSSPTDKTPNTFEELLAWAGQSQILSRETVTFGNAVRLIRNSIYIHPNKLLNKQEVIENARIMLGLSVKIANLLYRKTK